MQNIISSLGLVAVSIKSIVNRSRDLLKRSVCVHECYVCVASHIAAITTSQIRPNIAAKIKQSGSRRFWRQLYGKNRRLVDEANNLTSKNERLRTVIDMVATFEQTKKGLSYFYPKRQVQDDGIQTKPLNL